MEVSGAVCDPAPDIRQRDRMKGPCAAGGGKKGLTGTGGGGREKKG